MLCSHQQALNAGPERCTRAQLHAGRRAPKVCTCRRNDLQPGTLTRSLAHSLTGAFPCLIWTRHAEASLSPDNCSFLQKNISLPHISEFTFLLLNEVVGEPGGVARGASTAQLARSGLLTQRGGATRHVGPSGTLVALGHRCCCFSCFFPTSDLSMFFFIIAKKKSNQNSQGLEVKGGATRQGRPILQH